MARYGKNTAVNWQKYTKQCYRTIDKDLTEMDMYCLCAMGLAGELGEVIEPLKKARWQGHPLKITKMTEEIGDLCWYLALLLDTLGLDLNVVLERNTKKTKKRYDKRGFTPDQSIHRKEYEDADADADA